MMSAPRMILVSLVSILVLSNAYSENLKVYRDRYLIEPEVAAASLGARQFDALNLKSLKKVGNAYLVKPSDIAAASSEEVVDYSAENDYCYKLLKSNLVKSCSPDYQVSININSNDPEMSKVWGMAEKGIDALSAWNKNTSAKDVVVAVLDSGVDYLHQDLKDNMWVNTAEIPANGIDDDANGYVDDIHGIDTLIGSGNPMPKKSYEPGVNPATYGGFHGTHCAGTIAARGNNGIGVAGAAWQAKVMALKFIDWNGSGPTSGAVQAIEYVLAMKRRGVNIRVVSASFGSNGYSEVFENAVRKLSDAGIIFVAAAGNSAKDNDVKPVYPANFAVPNIISVAAIDQDQNLANFSCFGSTTVDIAAPGVRIFSTMPDNQYGYLDGTSMATPHVAGALTLLFGTEPNLSVSAAIQRVYASGVDKPSLRGLVATGRALNLNRMVTNQVTEIPNPVSPDPCDYAVNNVGFSPDTSADRGNLIIQADELDYYTVNLPFNFRFQDEDYQKIVISPNGVVYFAGEPSILDFMLGATAPANSFAAFHADLDSTDVGGVRVNVTNNKVVIFWDALSAANPGLGRVKVRAVLGADGSISSHVDLANASLAGSFSNKYIVGVTGQSEGSARKFSSSDVKFGVNFVSSCKGNGGGNPTDNNPYVSSIQITKLNSAKSAIKLGIDLNGSGTGVVNLTLNIDGVTCNRTLLPQLNAGAVKLQAQIKKSLVASSRLSISSGSASRSYQLIGNSRRRSISPETVCTRLINNMRYR